MLDKKFIRSGLEGFEYRSTSWYQAIHTENRSYKRNLLLLTLVVALALFAVLSGYAVFIGRYQYLVSYGLYSCLIAAALVMLVRARNLRDVILFSLAAPFVGLCVSMLLPCEHLLFFPVLAIYPVYAMHLRGTRQGTVWSVSYALSFAAFAAVRGTRILPFSPAPLEFIDFVGAVFAFGVVFAFAFVTERRQETVIERLADRFVFDEVTGLPGKDVMLHSMRKDGTYYVAILKIENFSNLVALFGYEFSDTISQFASRKLVKYESKFGYKTYQLKHNEYGILVDSPSGGSIPEFAQYLNDLVNSLEVESLPWERDRISLVYRVGATMVTPADSGNPFSRADIALKKGERGHSAITIFENDSGVRENAYDYVMKFTELVSNRENDSFLAVFQPVFNGAGSEVAWYEALLRVRRQDGGYSSIFPYLEVAKSTGFYQYITEFIIRRSVEMILEHDVDISINIAIHDIVRPEFILLVEEVAGKIKDRKGRIIFEILESDELVELDKCLWFIDYISRYGFKIAIDDFGTGYSNYCSLINLPIDIVKIDGSLIRKIHRDENAKILVEGIVQFCEKSNKKTVAEYVESKEVFDSLRNMKIDFLQGYYLGEPAPLIG